jgi:ABC-type polysaccharide/polyol phosphate transport system ATPase subunit
MSTGITIDSVSLKFRLYHEKGLDLKAMVAGLLRGQRRKAYTDFWALNDLSLNIGHGERIGVIGHNGAGKSTLLKVLSGIYFPDRGKVMVDGRLCSLLEIGTGFHPELTGRENIRLYASIYGLSRVEALRMFDDVVAFTDLAAFIDTPVKYFSTGMYGRLAFATATAVRPEILVLDEMFAGADQDFITKASKRMVDFMAAASIVVLVSHELDLVRRFCSRVVWLDHGQLKQDGPIDQVLSAYDQPIEGDTIRPQSMVAKALLGERLGTRAGARPQP